MATKTRNRIISSKVLILYVYIYIYVNTIEITYFMDYTPVSIDFGMSWHMENHWKKHEAMDILRAFLIPFPQISGGWLWGPRACCAALALEPSGFRIWGIWGIWSVRAGDGWGINRRGIWGVPKSGRSRRLLTLRRTPISSSTHLNAMGNRELFNGKNQEEMDVDGVDMDADGNFTPTISGHLGKNQLELKSCRASSWIAVVFFDRL